MPGYRKRPDDDLEAGTDEEEEKLLSLGAWFQCGVWFVVLSLRAKKKAHPASLVVSGASTSNAWDRR